MIIQCAVSFTFKAHNLKGRQVVLGQVLLLVHKLAAVEELNKPKINQSFDIPSPLKVTSPMMTMTMPSITLVVASMVLSPQSVAGARVVVQLSDPFTLPVKPALQRCHSSSWKKHSQKNRGFWTLTGMVQNGYIKNKHGERLLLVYLGRSTNSWSLASG